MNTRSRVSKSRGSRITYPGRLSISHRCPIELLFGNYSSINGGVTRESMEGNEDEARKSKGHKRPSCSGRETRPPLVEYRSQSGDSLKPVLGEQCCPRRRG